MDVDYWLPEQYLERPAPLKKLSKFDLGFIDGKAARTSGKYGPAQIRAFLQREAGSHDTYVQGYCKGLHGNT